MNFGGTGAATGIMTIGGGTGTQTLNIASNSGAKTINLGVTTSANTINVNTGGTAAQTTNVGSTSSTSTTTINGGTGVTHGVQVAGGPLVIATSVANTNIATGDMIFIERTAVNASSALGVFGYTISNGTSFTINALSTLTATTLTADVSSVTYIIIRPV
jgi:hypothetical protein